MDDQAVIGLDSVNLFEIPEFVAISVEVTAWAVDNDKKRRKMYQRSRVVGHMSKEKILSKDKSVDPKGTVELTQAEADFFLEEIEHPHADLVVADYHMTIKLPNIVPIDYSSCEVMIGCHWLTSKKNFIKSVKHMRPVIGQAVQEDLNLIAEELGGVVNFGQKTDDDSLLSE